VLKDGNSNYHSQKGQSTSKQLLSANTPTAVAHLELIPLVPLKVIDGIVEPGLSNHPLIAVQLNKDVGVSASPSAREQTTG